MEYPVSTTAHSTSQELSPPLNTINPIGAHAIAKGAYKNGIRPDKEMEIDDYGRDINE